jgi:hypothetical protein
MALAAAFLILAGSVAEAQLGMFSKEQREAVTAERTGERFEERRSTRGPRAGSAISNPAP